MTTPPPTEALQDLISHRRSRLEAVRQTGENPFPATCPVTHLAQEVLNQWATLPPEGASEDLVTVAGRLMTRRDMGKAAFAHVLDVSGKLQVYLRQDLLGETLFDHWKNWVDLGDFVGFTGHPFRTRTGEITLKVTSWTLLSKALRPPPEKFHGMTDVEERYRRREVDLFSNPAARETFIARSRVLRSLRSVLEGRQFLEVETPIMQTVPGGAAARPFSTHHEALDMNLFLRIAPELFLKRLLVGGLDRVFEIGRAFRNEGIDTRHNPEFTILEAYQAYTDVRGMMELCEVLVREAARAVKGDGALSVHYRGVDVNLAEPFAKISLPELFEKKTKGSFAEACRSGDWRATARRAGLNVSEEIPQAKAFDHILDELILPGLPPASFLLGYPSAFSPLAKCPRETPEVADRFELFIAGEEVANAYSEQNDPDTQRRHFEEQARHRQAGDAEAMPADEEFLLALEQGMPPAGGLGIGIDRLTMLLTSKESIREVILFPLLRPPAQ